MARGNSFDNAHIKQFADNLVALQKEIGRGKIFIKVSYPGYRHESDQPPRDFIQIGSFSEEPTDAGFSLSLYAKPDSLSADELKKVMDTAYPCFGICTQRYGGTRSYQYVGDFVVSKRFHADVQGKNLVVSIPPGDEIGWRVRTETQEPKIWPFKAVPNMNPDGTRATNEDGEEILELVDLSEAEIAAAKASSRPVVKKYGRDTLKALQTCLKKDCTVELGEMVTVAPVPLSFQNAYGIDHYATPGPSAELVRQAKEFLDENRAKFLACGTNTTTGFYCSDPEYTDTEYKKCSPKGEMQFFTPPTAVQKVEALRQQYDTRRAAIRRELQESITQQQQEQAQRDEVRRQQEARQQQYDAMIQEVEGELKKHSHDGMTIKIAGKLGPNLPGLAKAAKEIGEAITAGAIAAEVTIEIRDSEHGSFLRITPSRYSGDAKEILQRIETVSQSVRGAQASAQQVNDYYYDDDDDGARGNAWMGPRVDFKRNEVIVQIDGIELVKHEGTRPSDLLPSWTIDDLKTAMGTPGRSAQVTGRPVVTSSSTVKKAEPPAELSQEPAGPPADLGGLRSLTGQTITKPNPLLPTPTKEARTEAAPTTGTPQPVTHGDEKPTPAGEGVREPVDMSALMALQKQYQDGVARGGRIKPPKKKTGDH